MEQTLIINSKSNEKVKFVKSLMHSIFKRLSNFAAFSLGQLFKSSIAK